MVATAGTEPEVRTYSSRQTLHLVVRRHPIPRTTQSQSSSRSQWPVPFRFTYHHSPTYHLVFMAPRRTPNASRPFEFRAASAFASWSQLPTHRLHGPNCRPIASPRGRPDARTEHRTSACHCPEPESEPLCAQSAERGRAWLRCPSAHRGGCSPPSTPRAATWSVWC